MVFWNPGRSEGLEIRWLKVHFRRTVERRQRGLDRFVVRPPFRPTGGEHALQSPSVWAQALKVLGCETEHDMVVPPSFRARQGQGFSIGYKS